MQAQAVEAKKSPSLLTTGITLIFAGVIIANKGEHVTPDAVKQCASDHAKADKSFRQAHGNFFTEAERLEFVQIGAKYRACLRAAGNNGARPKTPATAANTNESGVIYDFK